jgi:hypothetical protein
MRKIITYLLLSYGIITASFAQQDSTLLLLDKTEITTGVLYPYLANDSTASWLKLGGDTNSISNSKRWKQLYAEYVYYNLESHLLPSLDSIIKQAEYEINYNRRVPLMIMDINYHAFKSYAIDSGLIVIENGKFMDNPDRTESPYIEKQLFVAAPFMEKMMNDTLTFFISSDFYFLSSSLPQTIEIDFADGNGFQQVQWKT